VVGGEGEVGDLEAGVDGDGCRGIDEEGALVADPVGAGGAAGCRRDREPVAVEHARQSVRK
jgi:hypothetical protein